MLLTTSHFNGSRNTNANIWKNHTRLTNLKSRVIKMLAPIYVRRSVSAMTYRSLATPELRIGRKEAVNRFSTSQYLQAERGAASNHPKKGSSTTGVFKVLPTDLASVVSPDSNDVYPEVFATSRLAAFMEIVCARMLVPHMSKGQLSVGVRVDMMHTAATPVDADVTVQATYRGKEGKLFAFDVVAHDAGGEIGKALHTRAIVDETRLMGGIKKRFGDGGSKA